jgi:hypothetical protein
MSGMTWMREHYPITADAAARLGLLAAAEHSLHKWEGFSKEERKKHNVHFVHGYSITLADATGEDIMSMGSTTCAYCILFYECGGIWCTGCPLSELQENCLESDSIYKWFISTLDPRPMIRLLERALRLVKVDLIICRKGNHLQGEILEK